MNAVPQTVIEPPRAVPAPRSRRAPVVKSESQTLMDAIVKASKDPKVDVNKLERLMAMHERITAKQAETAFNAAMVLAKAEMPKILKGGTNDHTKSSYATLEGVSETADPIITKHGFVLSYSTAESTKADHYRVVCHVKHRDGHSETHFLDLPSDGVGAKGNANMNRVQGVGSTMSYGRRYLKCMIFDIVTTDDDDGNGGQMDGVYVTAEQVRELDQALRQVNANLPAFLTYMGVQSLATIPIKRFHEAKTAIEAKRRKS